MHEEAATPPAAPLLLRGVAFVIDAMLALLTVVAAALLLPGARAGPWQPDGPLFGGRDLGLAILLLALRDVVFPASPAKWLLCLRVERPSGAALSFAARLARAPLTLLPLWLVPRLESRLGWRVRLYVPGRAGLVLRSAFTAGAVLVSVAWAVTTLRPSIATDDAERLASELVRSDAQLRELLGQPVRCDVHGVARRGEQVENGTARFWLRLYGTHARQDMQVHARRVDGAWVVEELSDIEINPPGDGPDVAEK